MNFLICIQSQKPSGEQTTTFKPPPALQSAVFFIHHDFIV